MQTAGSHLLVEYHHCDRAVLDDPAALEALMRAAVDAVGATPLHVVTHRFAPQGVTVLIALAESHISLHTWPEHGYAAMDCFTCGGLDPEQAHPVLVEGLASGASEVLRLARGMGPPGRSIVRRDHRVEADDASEARPALLRAARGSG